MLNNSSKLRIEAEDYQDYYDLTPQNLKGAYRNDGVDIWEMNSASNNYYVGTIQKSEWLTYNIDVPEDGTYKIVSRVGSKNEENRKFSVSTDEERAITLNFDSDREKYWQNITSENVELRQGKQQLRLDMLSSDFSIDYLDLISVSTSNNSDNNSASTANTSSKGNGLKGEYYENKDFTDLKFARTDSRVDFNWGKDSPDSAMDVDAFSVRWSGQIEPRFSETYKFHTTSDDGVRLWVDGRLIIDRFVDRASTEDTAAIDLVAGQKYDIRLEYYENKGKANASLAWSSHSQSYEIVPQSQLYSELASNNVEPDVLPDIKPIQNSEELKSVKVDSNSSDRVWLANGLSVWNTEDALANNSKWSARIDGIEESVAFDAVSTPGGALITAIADFDGFRHTDIHATPNKNHSDGEFSTTTSISYSPGNPDFLVRASSNHHDYSQQSGYSLDNGATWQKFASIENGNHPNDLSFGNIAVSASNTDNIVWQGSDWAVPYYTKDGGHSWNRIDFFDQFGGGAHTHLWNRQQALTADSIIDGTFYIYHHTGGQLVRTRDGGESWAVANQDNLLPSGVWSGANVKTSPKRPGDVWVSLDDKGLYRSTDAGETFAKINGVQEADAIGFGKAAPGKENPTVFVSGKIRGQMGVFGSTDMGNTWTQFTDLPDRFLGEVRSITGDMNTFGRVYLGVSSNGFVYGDL